MTASALLGRLEIDIVDLGAAVFGANTPRYRVLADHHTLRVVGFEPNARELTALTERFADDAGNLFLPYAIGDGTEREYRRCKLPGCSSLLEPNMALAAQYRSFAEWMSVEDRTQVQTRRLDDVPELSGADLIKLDIQGGERDAIRFGKRLMSSALVIECEVNFVQQYVDQPLFSEIELELRQLGFQFHRFLGYGSRLIEPLALDSDPFRPGSQWLWSDAVFVRDTQTWDALPDEALPKLAIILGDAYGSVDFACRALSILDSRGASTLAADYQTRLRSPGALG